MTASIIGKPDSQESDHHPIIRHLRFNETPHGGWDEWSVACICGELYKTTSGGWYVPSRAQAERIYNRHIGKSLESELEQETPEEALERWAKFLEDA